MIGRRRRRDDRVLARFREGWDCWDYYLIVPKKRTPVANKGLVQWINTVMMEWHRHVMYLGCSKWSWELICSRKQSSEFLHCLDNRKFSKSEFVYKETIHVQGGVLIRYKRWGGWDFFDNILIIWGSAHVSDLGGFCDPCTFSINLV